MKILSKFFNRTNRDKKFQEESKKYVLPDTFEITKTDVSYYFFMMHSKAQTHPSELEKNGLAIDREIEAYKQTETFKILNTKLKDLDIQAVFVKKPPYVDGNYDLTLSLENQKFLELVFNPSEGVGLLVKMCQKGEITLGTFLYLSCPNILEFEKVTYTKAKNIEFLFGLSWLRGHKDNDNEEVTFLANLDDRGAGNINEYISQEQEKSYSLNMISDSEAKIIIENLSVTEEEIYMLEEIYNQISINSFIDLANALYQNFNNRIAFIGNMNGTLIIKGTDKEENNIYTTLKEEELTPGMKSILETKKKK